MQKNNHLGPNTKPNYRRSNVNLRKFSNKERENNRKSEGEEIRSNAGVQNDESGEGERDFAMVPEGQIDWNRVRTTPQSLKRGC